MKKISPITDEDFKNLFNYCEKVEKEFIEIGDAGENNNLMVGRFMTDKDKPEIVNNPYSQKLLKILKSEKLIDLIKKILNLRNKVHKKSSVQPNK